MNFDFNQSGDVGVLSFEGDLTGYYTEDLRAVFLISISSVNHIVLNFDKVVNIAPECLQCLCQSIRISRKLKKNVVLTGDYLKDLKLRLTDYCLADSCCGCAIDSLSVLDEELKP